MSDAARRIADARRLFVEVRFQYAPFDASLGVPQNRYWHRIYSWGVEEKAENGTTISEWGVRGPEDGLVAAPLLNHDLDHLEDLRVADADDREHPAAYWGISRHEPIVWLKAESLKTDALPALMDASGLQEGNQAWPLGEWPNVRMQLGCWQAKLAAAEAEIDRRFRLDRHGEPNLEFEHGLFRVLFNPTGDWMGWLQNGSRSPAVVSPRVAAGEALRWEDWKRRGKTAEERLKRSARAVRLRLKPEPSGSLYGYGASQKDRTDLCLSVGRRTLFCPKELPTSALRRVQAVEWVRDAENRPGRLVGVLNRTVVGYLVAVEEDLEPVEPAPLPADRTLAIALEWQLVDAEVRVRSSAERLRGIESGYRGAKRRNPRFLREVGGFVADLEGNLAGMLVEEARHEMVLEKRYGSRQSLVRLHPLRDLIEAFSDPAKAVDPKLKSAEALDPKRRPWLGMETQNVTPELAQLLKVSVETREGTIGQIVNYVAPGSPADRAGVKAGDVLLRWRDTSKRGDSPIPNQAQGYASGPTSQVAYFFRHERTGLDSVLDAVSPGSMLALSYWRGGRTANAELRAEASPPDVESSPKLMDKATGLSVKELTGDVRRLLRLEPEFSGLLVYEVESGSPAEVAGIRSLELLVEADGRPVGSLGDLDRMLKERRAAGGGALRVRTMHFGRSRFADLRLAAPAPEGITAIPAVPK
ncbi:MAG: hypothetical protein HY554_10620 [Elusimicrobia bacterium]|nr:hypothetical protein [Elusimicrobiota bacterium]